MKKLCLLVVGIIILLLPLGCTDDLAATNFSGEYEMVQYENDWAYLQIASKNSSFETENPRERFGSICSELEMKKEIILAGKRYDFEMNFSNRDGSPRVSAWESTTGNSVNLNSVSGNGEGNEWGDPVERAFYTPKKIQKMQRTYNERLNFFESNYNERFIVEVIAKAEVAERYDTGKKVPLKPRKWKVSGSSSMNIGNTLALQTGSNFNGVEVNLYLLDYDLNGELNEKDRIYCDYTKKFLGFNTPVRLTGSFSEKKDNYYKLSLAKSDVDNKGLKLVIELVREGEEAKETKGI